ncbi:MAG: hypothetical protein IKH61_12780 [Bacteroidales bacterium]|nr:hypothetical protein [Bacteroidales bacterium]
MATGNGGLHFEPTMDVNQIRKSAKEVKREITDTTKTVEALGTAFDLMTDITKQDIKDQQQYIKGLEAEYAKLEKRLKKMPKGAARTEIQGQMNSIRHEIESEKEALNAMEQSVQKNSKAHQSFRTQLRKVNQEMMELAANGQRDSQAYRDLQAKAVELRKNMGLVAKQTAALSSPVAGFKGVASVIAGMTGAFAAANGVIGLFGSNSENLNKIMMRTQSLMAITMGLQQVANTLYEGSAFKVAFLSKVKALFAKNTEQATAAEVKETVAMGANSTAATANTTATTANAAAQTANTAATTAGATATKGLAGAFKALGAAIKKVPVFGWIIAIVSALVGIVAHFVSKAREAAKVMDDLRKKTADLAAKPVAAVELLSMKFAKLGDDMQAKEKFVKQYADAFKELGVDVHSVADAENLLIKNKDAFVQAQMEKAKAHAAQEMAQEIMAKKLKLELEMEQTTKQVFRIPAYKRLQKQVKAYDDQIKNMFGISANAEANAADILAENSINAWNQYAEGTVGAIEQAIAEKREALKNVTNLEDYNKILGEIDTLQKQLDKITGNRKKFMDNTLQEQLRYIEELRKAKERAEDLELNNKPDTVETRVERIQLQYDRQIAEATGLRDAAKTDELKREYQRQIDALMDARDKAIQDEYDKEAEAHKELIAEMLGNYMTYSSRREAINKKYEADIELMRKEAEAMPENSRERLAMEEAIAEAERQQSQELLDLDVEYGRLNKLVAQREELEKRILVTADKIAAADDDATREALLDEIKKLKEELKKVNKEIDDMTESLEESGDAVEGFLSSSNYGQVIEAVDKLIESLELCGVVSKDTAGQLSDMWGIVDSAVKGYMSGGAFGMFLSLLNYGLDLANKAAVEAQEAKKIMNDMIILFEKLNLQLSSNTTIFGDDPLGDANEAFEQQYVLLEKIRNKLTQMGYAPSFDPLSGWDYQDMQLGGHWLDLVAQRWGTHVMDGDVFNVEFLKQFLEAYGDDLSEEERVFLEHLINYSEQYKDNMEEIASYLTSLFGEVADTIADQMIDSFLESGQAATDFGSIVSDIVRKMAKDFIKSLLFERVLLGWQQAAEDIMNSDMSNEDKAAAFYAMLLDMASQINEDVLPDAQAFLEAWASVFGDTVGNDDVLTGNLLQTATQDSVSLLNGQLNAMRQYQGRMEDAMRQVLLSLANINQDMNDGFSQSINHLRDISYNTSEHGTILRAFGLG